MEDSQTFDNPKPDFQMMENNFVKPIKKVRISEDIKISSDSVKHTPQDPIQTSSNIEKCCDLHICRIYGYTFPKKTIYLMLILVIIAIVIWYMSTPNKKPKKDEDNK